MPCSPGAPRTGSLREDAFEGQASSRYPSRAQLVDTKHARRHGFVGADLGVQGTRARVGGLASGISSNTADGAQPVVSWRPAAYRLRFSVSGSSTTVLGQYQVVPRLSRHASADADEFLLS